MSADQPTEYVVKADADDPPVTDDLWGEVTHDL